MAANQFKTSFSTNTNALGLPSTAATAAAKEELLPLLTNLDKKKKAALFLWLPKGSAASLMPEWFVDSLAATAAAAVTEGAYFASGSTELLTSRTRYRNIVQAIRRDFDVSMDEVVLSQHGQVAGVQNEWDYQVEKKGQELIQSFDARLTQAANDDMDSTNRYMRNLRGWARASGVATSISAAFATDKFINLQEAMFNTGADPDTLLVSPGVKLDVTQAFMAQPSGSKLNFMQPANDVYDLSVDYIRTDLGRVAIIVDRFMPQVSTTATDLTQATVAAYYLFEREALQLLFFRPIKQYTLPQQGDGFCGYIHGSCTLKVAHASQIGWGTNVTT